MQSQQSISVSMIENKMKTIPTFELSYETSSSHRKVYTSNSTTPELVPNRIENVEQI